ncbi:hypothetical protein [Actinoallomurus sp. CA-142502]|uniref:hypothetical protein n=1 Tax=Actinoallomurus sp. CA-142502 TaxID=3239885 RepID=UPI003D89E5FE
MTDQAADESVFAEWAILELLGHRRLAGRVTEAQIAGASFLRIDVPSEPPATQFYAPGAVYAITPTTEEIARAVARRYAPAPVQRYELGPLVPADREADAPWNGGGPL